jgi:hypothetical protein
MNKSSNDSKREPRYQTPTLFDLFFGKVANWSRARSRRRREGRLRDHRPGLRKKALLEALEPRLLLSADIAHTIAPGVALDASLKTNDNNGQQFLQLVDNGSSAVLAETIFDQDVNVAVVGGDLDDVLSIEFDIDSVLHQVRVNFDGGDGNDTLVGPSQDSTWTITDADSGYVGNVVFTDVENLTGAANNQDTFVFDASGSLSGLLEGGDGGFDVVEVNAAGSTSIVSAPTGPDSGFIILDGSTIQYAGFEPVLLDLDVGANVSFDLSQKAASPAPTNPGVDDVIELRSVGGGQFILESLNDTFEDTTFTDPGASGSVTIDLGVGNDNLTLKDTSVLQASLTVKGGAGDDTYTFDGAAVFGDVTITELAGEGNDTLDFSNYSGGFAATGTISYTDEVVERTVGVALNESTLLAGLDELVAWADSLDSAGKLGQALAVVSGNVGVGVGTSLALAEVFDQLRLEIKNFIDDPSNPPLTSDNLQTLLAAFNQSGLAHFDRSIVGDTRDPALSPSDSFTFKITLDDEPLVDLNVQGDANLQNFVNRLNSAIGLTSLVGRLQAIQTDDGRIGFQVTDSNVNKLTINASGAAAKLGFGTGDLTKENLRAVLGGLGELDVGVQGAVSSELTFAANGTPELRFKLLYAADRASKFNIDLGEEAAKLGVSFDTSSSLKLDTSLETDLALGLTLDSTDDFFVDVSRFDLSATNTNVDTDHTQLSGDVNIGFLGAALAPPSGTDPAPEISIVAGLNLNAPVSALTNFDAAEQTSFLAEIDYDSNNVLKLDLPIQVKPGIPGFAPLVEIKYISQQDSIPFTGSQLPLVELDGAEDRSGGDNFHNFNEVKKFQRLDPTGFIEGVGKVRDFLGKASDSELFAGFDIPFNTTPLSKVAELGDAIDRALLFDDGGDGKDDNNDTKLVTDINNALSAAGIDDLIRASIDVSSSKIVLTAISSNVTGFSLSSAANNELGFDTSQTAVRADPADRLTLSALAQAPATGKLTAGDATFDLTVTKAAGDVVVKTITVTQQSTDNNVGLGNDIEKLLDTSRMRRNCWHVSRILAAARAGAAARFRRTTRTAVFRSRSI